MKRPLLVFVLFGAAVLVCGAGYLFAAGKYQASPTSWPRETFSSQTWLALPAEERFRLYNDLAARKLLEGKARVDVTTLLGKPSFESSDGRYMTYVLKSAKPGEYTLNAIYLLQIDLNGDGRVKQYFIRSD